LKTIDLVYFNAGGGHRASALALKQSIEAQGLPWRVRLVNLFEILDPRDLFRRFTGMRPEDLYNLRLAHGWTAGMTQELKLLQAVLRLGHATIVRRLARHWLATEPDMVVSLIPNFNRALFDSLAGTLPGVPYVTVMTDLADWPPNFWMERGQDQHFICGTPRAVEQARSVGYTAQQVHATSGMILRPDFYQPRIAEPQVERCRHGLDPQHPTGIVMFGGHGSKAMLTIAERLPDTQLILVCGHNEALARRLRAMPAFAPRLVLGFTDRIPAFMDLADFFIGKPGPGSLSEAIQRGLPVIVARNAWTMPQERYNGQWVRENGVGLVIDGFRSVAGAVDDLLARIDEFRARVDRMENRAVHEIPPILARILADSEMPLEDAARSRYMPGQVSARVASIIGSRS
jgi:hypothetical protein